MIVRYTDERIERIWALLNKYKLWQDTEIAYLYAWEKWEKFPGVRRELWKSN